MKIIFKHLQSHAVSRSEVCTQSLLNLSRLLHETHPEMIYWETPCVAANPYRPTRLHTWKKCLVKKVICTLYIFNEIVSRVLALAFRLKIFNSMRNKNVSKHLMCSLFQWNVSVIYSIEKMIILKKKKKQNIDFQWILNIHSNTDLNTIINQTRLFLLI